MSRATLVRRSVITLALALAVGLLVVGFQDTRDESKVVCPTDTAVKDYTPQCGDLDLRQTAVTFQLDNLYTGRLVLSGPEGRFQIPDDQLFFQPGLNRWAYTPGPGTETGPLRPGLHTATIVLWKKGSTEAATGRSLSWRFNLH